MGYLGKSEIILNGSNFKPGEQEDESVIDIHGNRIGYEDRLRIMDSFEQLPVHKRIYEILYAHANNPIIIIGAQTGSGKTTQIPKRLFLQETGKQVIVTQPRVLSATSIGDRVSKELLAEFGDPRYSIGLDVGYRTGRIVSSKHTSRLSFHTDGLELMRQIISGKFPDVLFLDEIHGYSIPTEIIAKNVRDFMLKNKGAMRLVLMSATLKSSILQDYFRKISTDIPYIEIPGRLHKVREEHTPGENPIDLVASLYNKGKNILYFVEGKKEIQDAIKRLKGKLGSDVIIYPLHAEISKAEQDEILNKKTDKPVIIVSTNVAEEAITIDYIDAVVDSGREKSVYVNENGIDKLVTQDISQANSKQRAGRAGRTHDGEYFRTNKTETSELKDFPLTPIEKEMLDREILLLAANGIKMLKNVGNFIHKPNKRILEISYNRLKSIGALDSNGNITKLGVELIQLPLSVYNAMVLHEAIRLGCGEDILWMVSILEKKSFLSKSSKWKKLNFGGQKEGDLFYYANLLKKLTARRLSDSDLSKFLSVGVKIEEIEEFKKLKGEKMFFEVVKSLGEIGIKIKKIYEIYNLIETLQIRLNNFGINLNNQSSDIDKVKRAFTAGNTHNIFQFNKKGGFFTNFDDEEEGLKFQQGDVSVATFRNGQYCLGSPFIIAGEGENAQDFNLLTNIIPISQEIAEEYRHRNIDEFYELFGLETDDKNENKAYIPTKTDLDRIWFDSNGTRDNTTIGIKGGNKSRHYLAKNWLPGFLVTNNDYVKKYIEREQEKNPAFDINRFIILLAKITVGEAHRIDPVNMNSTKISFRHDTFILDSFLASNDPGIVAFLKGRSYDELLENECSVQKEEIGLFDLDIIEPVSTNELRNAKNEFFRLIREFDKETDLNNFIKRIKLNTLKNLVGEHIDIHFSKLKIFSGNLSNIDFVNFSKRLRVFALIKERIRRLNLYLERIEKLINRIKSILNGGNINLDISDIEYFTNDKKIHENFRRGIDLIKSKDTKKRKRGERYLVKILNFLEKKKVTNSENKEEYVSQLNFDDLPELKEFAKYIGEFLNKIFDNEYLKTEGGKIINFMRTIINLINSKKDFDFYELFKEFILNFNFSRLKDNGNFIKVEGLNDIMYNLQTSYIIQKEDVEKSGDLEYIKGLIEDLKKMKENYDNIKGSIMR